MRGAVRIFGFMLVSQASWAMAQNVPYYPSANGSGIPTSQKGVANGVATLDSGGNIPLNQLANVPASALPNATASGQTLVSSGAGNTYAVRALTASDVGAATPAQITSAVAGVTPSSIGAMATGAAIAASQIPSQLNPVTSSSVNDVFYASGYPSGGCAVGGTVYSEQLSCAFYTALAAAVAGNKGVTLRLGVKQYSTSVTLDEGANTQAGVSIVGEGQGQTQTPTNDQSVIVATASLPAVIMHDDMPKTGGLTGNLRFEGFTVDGNNLASECMDMYGLKQTYYHNIILRRCFTGTQAITFGHRGAPTGDYVLGFQNDVDGVFVVGDGTGETSWATTTVALASGVPTATVTAGGTYTYQTPPAYLLGYGTGRTPCTTMGTATANTTASGSKWTVSSVTLSGFAGCTGTMYLSIPDLPTATFGVSINDTDSVYNRVRVQSVGRTAGDSEGGGDNAHFGEHDYGMPVGIQDFTANRWYGLEFDSNSQFGFDLESSSQVYGASSFWNAQFPFAADFKVGSGALGAKIVGHVCNNQQTAGSYAQFVNSSGPMTSFGSFTGNLQSNDFCDGSGNTLNYFGQGITADYVSQTPGSSIASALTVAPVSGVTHITGVAAIATITPPPNFSGGCLTFIADGAWSVTTAGNIFAVMTASVGTPYQFCYDGSKFYGK